VQIWLAPLRKRKSDIPLLTDHFINKYKKENSKDILGLTKESLDKLMKYDFPGNVRELENIIERAVVLCRGEYITTNDLPANVNQISEKGVLDPYNLKDGYESKMQSFEKEMLVEALQQSGGNQSAAARLLGITERHLRSRLERTGLK
jgi:DNA-binding NtrC family response regulator